MMRYGNPDGYGRHGILDTDEDGLLVCHECGQGWKHLATHARLGHGIKARDYREAHGLPLTQALVAPAVSEKMRESWEKNEALHLATIEGLRDPDRAQRSSRGGTWSVGTRARQSQRNQARASRDLTPAEVEMLGDLYDIPTWTANLRVLMAAHPELSQVAIGRSVGISAATVAQRLRRYPA